MHTPIHVLTCALEGGPGRGGTWPTAPSADGRRAPITCLSWRALFLYLADRILQAAFAFLSPPQRSQGSPVRPFALLPNPKHANSSMWICFGEGSSPITDLTSQFASPLPHKGMRGPSAPPAQLQRRHRDGEGAPFGSSNALTAQAGKWNDWYHVIRP